eukprot:GHVU01129538.1.p3 GENE.GHVU01129538.1~~GHVU01129538.1.p3  ORF type:complete len:100 (-),score=3.46 GHVU01129538.1:585-884(-)
MRTRWVVVVDASMRAPPSVGATTVVLAVSAATTALAALQHQPVHAVNPLCRQSAHILTCLSVVHSFALQWRRRICECPHAAVACSSAAHSLAHSGQSVS